MIPLIRTARPWIHPDIWRTCHVRQRFPELFDALPKAAPQARIRLLGVVRNWLRYRHLLMKLGTRDRAGFFVPHGPSMLDEAEQTRQARDIVEMLDDVGYGLAVTVPECAARAPLPSGGPDAPVSAQIIDLRAWIRKSRSIEQTAGPP